MQALYSECWSQDTRTDSDIYITLEALPTILGTLESLGAVLTGKFRNYIETQKGITPYMSNDIIYVLRFRIPEQDNLIFSTRSRNPREAVTMHVGSSIHHLKTNTGQYVTYVPSFDFPKSDPRVDVIVAQHPFRVITQFDFEACSSYLDMKTGELVVPNPADTCLRLTRMNNTDKNSRILGYFLKLAGEHRYYAFLLPLLCQPLIFFLFLFSELPSQLEIVNLAQDFINDQVSLVPLVADLVSKIKKAEGGIFAFCFDGNDSIDLSNQQDIQLVIIALLRRRLLHSAQRMFFFTYSSSLKVERYNSFDLHSATVNLFYPRCRKYSASPRNFTFVGDLGKLFQSVGLSSIMRPLSVGVTGVLLSWENEQY